SPNSFRTHHRTGLEGGSTNRHRNPHQGVAVVVNVAHSQLPDSTHAPTVTRYSTSMYPVRVAKTTTNMVVDVRPTPTVRNTVRTTTRPISCNSIITQVSRSL